jgi:hypothetical protein
VDLTVSWVPFCHSTSTTVHVSLTSRVSTTTFPVGSPSRPCVVVGRHPEFSKWTLSPTRICRSDRPRTMVRLDRPRPKQKRAGLLRDSVSAGSSCRGSHQADIVKRKALETYRLVDCQPRNSEHCMFHCNHSVYVAGAIIANEKSE